MGPVSSIPHLHTSWLSFGHYAPLYLHIDYLHESVIRIVRLSLTIYAYDTEKHDAFVLKLWESKAMWGDESRMAEIRKVDWNLPICSSIDLRVVAWTVLDTLRLELLLDVLGNTALHRDGVHPAHVFI